MCAGNFAGWNAGSCTRCQEGVTGQRASRSVYLVRAIESRVCSLGEKKFVATRNNVGNRLLSLGDSRVMLNRQSCAHARDERIQLGDKDQILIIIHYISTNITIIFVITILRFNIFYNK